MTAKPKFLVVDVETTGLSHIHDKLHGIGVAFEEDDTAYYSFKAVPKNVVEMLADPEVHLVGHNLRFDLKFLIKAGFKVAGNFYDTKILASLVDENRPQGLKDLSEHFLGRESLQDKRELDRACSLANVKHVGELCRADMEGPGAGKYFDVIARYCQEDCNNTLKLLYVLSKKLKAQDRSWKEIRSAKVGPWDYFVNEAMPLEKILLDMELRGICVDMQVVDDTRLKFVEEQNKVLEHLDSITVQQRQAVEVDLAAKAREKRKTEAGKAKVVVGSDKYDTKFLWTSNAHLGKLLFEKVGAPEAMVSRTANGSYATSDQALSTLRTLLPREELLGQVLQGLEQFKRLEKLLSTYIGSNKGLVSRMHEGRIHPLYLQVGRSKEGGAGGTVTGRLSSQEPNIQNIPRSSGIKQFFVPSPGNVFVYADYSQLELRLAAHLSQDPSLLKAYKHNIDLHTLTASQIFGKSVRDVSKEERQVGKTVNFAMIYDAGSWRLMEEINGNGGKYAIEQVDAMRKAFFELYSRYKEYLNEQRSMVRSQQCLISAAGRVRRLPDIAYGASLDWRARQYTGTAVSRLRLLGHPNEQVSEAELFKRAKRKYNHALKQAYNFPIQSLGATVAKRAMVALAGIGANLSTQCHDAIIVEVAASKAWKASKKMKEVMESAYPLSVPLVAECKILQSYDESNVVTPEQLNELVKTSSEQKDTDDVKEPGFQTRTGNFLRIA